MLKTCVVVRITQKKLQNKKQRDPIAILNQLCTKLPDSAPLYV